MRREHQMEKRLRSLEALGETVTAVKSLSAHHLREVRMSLESARLYREGVDRLVQQTGASVPEGTGPAALVLIAGEFGLCGSYNQKLARAALDRRRELGEGPTIAVGRRGAALLGREGVKGVTVYPASASPRGIPDLLLRLTERMLTAYSAGRLSSVDVVSAHFEGVGAFRPLCRRLLPVDVPASGRPAPESYVRPGHLEAVAVRELIYITMYLALLDGLAAEHGSRLVATQSASGWLDRRVERLRRQLTSTRREAGTQEVIEIAGGARLRRR